MYIQYIYWFTNKTSKYETPTVKNVDGQDVERKKRRMGQNVEWNKRWLGHKVEDKKKRRLGQRRPNKMAVNISKTNSMTCHTRGKKVNIQGPNIQFDCNEIGTTGYDHILKFDLERKKSMTIILTLKLALLNYLVYFWWWKSDFSQTRLKSLCKAGVVHLLHEEGCSPGIYEVT